MRATQAEVSLTALKHNFELIKSCIKKETKICIPVKADAYGHGAVKIAQEVLSLGADYLAVAAVSEGIELRQAGITAPILLLSLPNFNECDDVIDFDITPLIFDYEMIDVFNELAEKKEKICSVHLKVNTGMGRIGCSAEDALGLAQYIDIAKNLRLGGICTHFSVTDSLDPVDVAYSKEQIATFSKVVDSIRKAGIDTGIVHAANSGAVLLYPESQFDMIRPGTIVYGYSPNTEIAGLLQEMGKLKASFIPLMEVKTRVSAIISHKAGEAISYGRTWVCDDDTDIAVLPIGYGDGILRNFAPGLKVLINNKEFPVVGRICMDQCMVYLGKNHGIKRWDEVTVIGNGIKCNSAEDIAKHTHTIWYEIITNINKRVKRVYIN